MIASGACLLSLMLCMPQERRGQKRIVQKAPGILANIYKRIFGGKKSTQPASKVPEGDTAPPAVPLSAAQQPAVAAA